MHINRVYMHIWVHFFIYTVAMDISGMRYCNLLTILYILKDVCNMCVLCGE